MSGTLALSAALAAMDRDALSALVVQRRPQAIMSISDPIGLAVEFLRADSIERAIATLERADLEALSSPDTASESRTARLLALGLVGFDDSGAVTCLDEVVTVLQGCFTRESEASFPEPPPIGQAQPVHGTESWYVAGLTAVAAAAETVRALRTRPGRMNRNGAVAVATVRATAEATGIDSAQISCSVQALISAGILAPASGNSILAWTPETAAWLDLEQPARWVALAAPTVRAMPAPLRTLLAEHDLGTALEMLNDRFPLLPGSAAATIRRTAELFAHLGLTVDGRLAGAARSLIESEDAAATTALEIAAAAMPAAVAGVYIQPDLSVIVPGPLKPADEADLALLSRPEQTGIASTRRITEATLAEAFESGQHLDTLHAMLGRLSLTGIPQPLEYLLTSLAVRVRSIVVHEHHGEELRTRIEVDRDDLRETLRIDRALQHLLLTSGPDPRSLYSRLRTDHVLAALGDARYTASLARGAEPTVMHTPLPQTASKLSEDLENLVDRVFTAARAEPNASAFTRRLELAIKDRRTVTVTAEAQGRTHVFTLLPTSLDSGRLRATDTRAGVERTLPVITITGVE